MKKIVLIGYMGSGKSTLAKALGEQHACPAYDLDDLIEQKIIVLLPHCSNQKVNCILEK